MQEELRGKMANTAAGQADEELTRKEVEIAAKLEEKGEKLRKKGKNIYHK